MDLFDRERTNCSLFETCGIIDLYEDFISDFIVTISSEKVFTTSIRINKSLPSLTDEIEISQNRDWMQHISLKGKSTRRDSESAMD